MALSATDRPTPGDVRITRARSAAWPELADIVVRDGRIAAIRPTTEGSRFDGLPAVDAAGCVVSPGFADLHLHLDKTGAGTPLGEDSVDVVAPGSRLARAAQRMTDAKATRSQEQVAGAARELLERALAAGTTAVRTHVDVDLAVGLRGLEGVLEARDAMAGRVDVQVAVLPAEPGWRHGGRPLELVREALASGADAIGGAPCFDPQPDAYLDAIFDLAERYGVEIDLHVDESDDPEVCVLETLAARTVASGFEGRVTAAHCCTLTLLPEADALRVIAAVADARITVVSLPLANLFLMGERPDGPPSRGITRVRDLLDAGVRVVIGSDNVEDAFVPYGNGDLLQAALVLALSARMGRGDDPRRLVELVTTAPTSVLRPGEPVGISVGARADLVAFATHDPDTLVARQPARRWVMRAGATVWADEELECLP